MLARIKHRREIKRLLVGLSDPTLIERMVAGGTE